MFELSRKRAAEDTGLAGRIRLELNFVKKKAPFPNRKTGRVNMFVRSLDADIDMAAIT